MENFWLCFAAIASTLSGFTLASYSIHITRAEVVASDPICRHYALRESASRHSLAFIFFILGMFLIPLLASLGFLVPAGVRSTLFVLIVLLIIFTLFWGIWSIKSTVQYLVRVARFQEKMQKLEDRTKEGLSSKAQGRILSSLLLLPLLILIALMALVLLWLVGSVARDAVHLRGSMTAQVVSLLPAWLVSSVPSAEILGELSIWASLLSVALGIVLIYFYFLLFTPLTLLFEVGSGARKVLAMTMHDIQDKRKAVAKLQRMLESILRNRDERWMMRLKVERGMREAEIQQLFLNEEKFAKGRHWDPEKKRSMSLVARGSYHRKRLRFCLDEDFVCYDQIIAMMSDVERYLQGLVQFEDGLKERIREYQEMVRFIENREPVTG